MSTADHSGLIRPDPHTPRCLGVLNIFYSLGLMASGLCINLMLLIPAILGYASAKQVENQGIRAQKQVQDIKRLEDEKVTSKDPARQEQIQTEIDDLKNEKDNDVEPLEALSDSRFRNSGYIGCFVADMASGLFLNFLMLIAGIGLYLLKPWARWLAIFVGYAKVLRLLCIAILMSVVVAPVVSSWVTYLESKMPAEGVESVGNQMAVMLAMAYWLVFILGSIYPVVMVVLLRRPSIRMALGRRER